MRDGIIDGLGDLVHESGEVLVASVAGVNFKRFVDDVTESSGSDEFVGGAPPLEGVGDKRVTESESGGEEGSWQGGLQFRIVFVQHSLTSNLNFKKS